MWDLKILYDSDKQWIKCYKEYAKKLVKLEIPKNDLENLKEIFNFIQQNATVLDDLYTYGLLRREQDILNKEVITGLLQIRQLYVELNKKLDFFLPFFRDNHQDILNKLATESELKRFYSYFLNMKLSTQNEIKEVYNKIAPYDGYMEWYNSFENIGTEPITHKEINEFNILNYLKSENKEERHSGYLAVEKFLKKML